MAEVPKKSKTDQPTEHFPDDLLIEIFLKLPARSLFLFRSVSKHWLKLIQSPDFITLHTNRPINNLNDHQPLLIVRSVKHELEQETRRILLTLLSDDKTLAYEDDIALELVSPSMASRGVDLCGSNFEEGKFHLLGPCNGLFCLTDSVDVVLLNPATKQSRKVPQSTLSPRTRMRYYMDALDYFDCVGFGFDSKGNYKVVRFEEINLPEFEDNSECDDDDNDEDDDYDDDGLLDHHLKIKIFSLSTSCWTELKCVVPTDYRFRIYSHNLFFNGAFHWLGGDLLTKYSILVFDLNEENFKQFRLPGRYSEGEEKNCVKLSVLNESLAAIVHDEPDVSIFDAEFNIWVMTKYALNTSWSKLYSITVLVGLEKPLSFSKNNEFFIENDHGQLVSFDLNTWETKKFQVRGVSGSMHAFRYKDSLVSLN